MQTIPEVSYSLILPTFLLFADSLVDSPILKSNPSLEGFGLNGRHFILTSSAKADNTASGHFAPGATICPPTVPCVSSIITFIDDRLVRTWRLAARYRADS